MKKKQKHLTWKDITLEKALKIEAMKSTGLDAAIELQAILKGLTFDEVERWTPKQLTDANKECEFVKELPKAKLNKDAKVNGRRYRMAELDKLSLAQMVDIEEYYNAGLQDNAHRIVSVLMLPAKRKFTWKWPFVKWEAGDYEPSEERENDMLQLDMELVWGNLLFFSTIVKEYTKGLRAYLAEILEETKRKSQPQATEAERQ